MNFFSSTIPKSGKIITMYQPPQVIHDTVHEPHQVIHVTDGSVAVWLLDKPRNDCAELAEVLAGHRCDSALLPMTCKVHARFLQLARELAVRLLERIEESVIWGCDTVKFGDAQLVAYCGHEGEVAVFQLLDRKERKRDPHAVVASWVFDQESAVLRIAGCSSDGSFSGCMFDGRSKECFKIIQDRQIVSIRAVEIGTLCKLLNPASAT
eukprot:gene4241-5223_t